MKKTTIWDIIGIVALILIIGSFGNIELSESIPAGSVVMIIISMVYLALYIFISSAEAHYTQEDFDLMQRDLDLWCFREQKGEKHESEQRRRTRKGTQKTLHRSKSSK